MLKPSKATRTGFPTREMDVVWFALYQRKMATWLGSYFSWAWADPGEKVTPITTAAANKSRFIVLSPRFMPSSLLLYPPITRTGRQNCNDLRRILFAERKKKE
jgi:hypothetical protein